MHGEHLLHKVASTNSACETLGLIWLCSYLRADEQQSHHHCKHWLDNLVVEHLREEVTSQELQAAAAATVVAAAADSACGTQHHTINKKDSTTRRTQQVHEGYNCGMHTTSCAQEGNYVWTGLLLLQ
jgi:hypothetical protein